jgi:probable phosphoglycerate mutase
MTHVYFIRHAQPEGLKPGIFGTLPPNTGLSCLGRKQAECLRDRLQHSSEIVADVLISSPLQRARETADIIAPVLGLPVLIDEGVQEINIGAGEGLTLEEIKERFNGVFDILQEPFRPMENGDSYAGFVMRTYEALDRLTRQYEGKTVEIVSHGGVIKVSFVYFMGLHPFNAFSIGLHCANTCITHWHRGISEQQKPLWYLEHYNDHAHLARLETD